MYNYIFATNIMRILGERKLTKKDLSNITGISISFISELTNGKANPSLNVLEKISNALDTPLSMLLESHDLGPEAFEELSTKPKFADLPPGYERVTLILPKQRAFIAKKWAEDAHNILNKRA